MLPILLLLVPPLHYGEVKCCTNFRRWCRRHAADITAVGAAFLHYGEVKCCPNFRRWCKRYAAQNVLPVFGADAGVYAADRRGLCLVLWDEYVTTTCSLSLIHI